MGAEFQSLSSLQGLWNSASTPTLPQRGSEQSP